MPEQARLPETRDVWPRTLLAFAGGLVLFLCVALVALLLLFDTSARWPPIGEAWRSNSATPALQPSTKEDLAKFRRHETKELTRLEWVNREAGIARIPIDDAMRIVAERGLPDWQSPASEMDERCRLLTGAVPRAPQAARCRSERTTTVEGTSR